MCYIQKQNVLNLYDAWTLTGQTRSDKLRGVGEGGESQNAVWLSKYATLWIDRKLKTFCLLKKQKKTIVLFQPLARVLEKLPAHVAPFGGILFC